MIGVAVWGGGGGGGEGSEPGIGSDSGGSWQGNLVVPTRWVECTWRPLAGFAWGRLEVDIHAWGLSSQWWCGLIGFNAPMDRQCAPRLP